MIKEIRFTAMLVLLLLATFPLQSKAADLTGQITVGGEIVALDHESFKSGEYDGILKSGFNFLGNADLKYSKDSYFMDILARNLGLDNRDLYLSAGIYGGYGMKLSYSETPHLISNTVQTIYTNAGSNALTLPAGFVKGTDTNNVLTGIGAAVLNASKTNYNLRVDRKDFSVALNMPYKVDDFSFLTVKLKYDHDSRKGTKELAGTLGTSAGDTRAVILPELVDYQTKDVTVGLGFSSKTFFAEVEYFNSQFSNKNESMTWESPYNTNALYPTLARTSLPPDNNSQRFSFLGGVSLPYSTRITVVGEMGMMKQDQTLLSYSINPASIINTQVPRSSANARIDTSHLTATVTSRPVEELSLIAKYRFYETVNKTPVDLFQYVINDYAGTTAPVTSAGALYNLPMDYMQNKVDFDAAYSILKGNILKLGYSFDQMSRDLREFNVTKENTYKIGWNSQIMPGLKGNVNFSQGKRRGVGSYNESNIYNNYHTQAYINTVATVLRWDNNPDLRRADIANRDKTTISANLHYSPIETATLGLYFSSNNEKYVSSPLGLQSRKNESFTADVNFLIKEDLNVFAYYTHENIQTKNRDRYFRGFAAMATEAFDPARDWSILAKDTINTIGIGADYTFFDELINVDANYSYSTSSSDHSINKGAALGAVTPLPKDRSSLHSFDLTTRYKYTEKITFGVGFAHEQYSSYNWSNANVAAASTAIANVITLIGPSSGYRATKGFVFLTYNLND